MSDPFASVDDECGEITASQEQILLNAPFLDPNPSSPPASSLSSDDDDDDDDHDDAPRDSTERQRDDEDLGLGESSQRRKPDRPVDTFASPSAAASGSASVARKLPYSSSSKSPSKETIARSGSEASVGAYPTNLREAVEMLSGELDEKLVDMDILEVLAMKGIEIPSPSWWPPGGYPDP